MEDGLNNIDDIDEMLDKEFNISEDVVDNDETDENVENEDNDVEEETTDLDENETESNQETGSEEPKNDVNADNKAVVKPTKEQQKEYAFNELRKENSSLKKQYEAASKSEAILKQIAAQYGYDDVDKFAEDVSDANAEKEAKAKGYDPVLYKELQKSNRRIAQLEKENNEARLKEKATNFMNSVDKAVENYNLGENGSSIIFDKLEKAGYSVDTVLSLPNPDIIIRGVLSDEIAEISKQKQITRQELVKDLSEDAHDGSSAQETFSLDDLIAQDMKEYKANNFYE